jgi:hypothetical protein
VTLIKLFCNKNKNQINLLISHSYKTKFIETQKTRVKHGMDERWSTSHSEITVLQNFISTLIVIKKTVLRSSQEPEPHHIGGPKPRCDAAPVTIAQLNFQKKAAPQHR